MDIIFHHPAFDMTWWINALARAIPDTNVREWKAGNNAHADYALVWRPPVEILTGWKLKAVFVLGTGVDSILSKLNAHPEMLDVSIPLFRLEDTGMGLQVQEYAVSRVLRWFRRFDDYQVLKNQAKWQPLSEYTREEFTVGIIGAGVLGAKVAEGLQVWGFPLCCWGRTRKSWSGVESFAGTEELGAFLNQIRVPVNLLPNMAETMGIINADLLSQLQDGAYVLNPACGIHPNEDDLLASLDSNEVKGAMLDAYSRESLPENSPLWKHPRATMTPHIAAIICPVGAVSYISRVIMNPESGQVVAGRVNRVQGY